jgi:hypothetical protein
MDDEQFLHARIPNVKILILDSLMISTLKFLESLSNLVALSLHCDPHPDVTWNLKEISNYAPRLTHLHLEYLNESSRVLAEEFQHGNLRYLSLRIDHDNVTRFSPQKITNWTFPCLETACIHGIVHQEHADSIGKFISRHSKGLKGLDMGYRIYMTDYSPGLVPPNLWELFPALTRLGIHCSYISGGMELIRKERHSDVLPPLELLVHDGFSYHVDPTELASALRGLITKWNISRIVLTEPWDKVRNSTCSPFLEYQVILLYLGTEGRAKKFSQSFKMKRVPVVDSLLVPLQDALKDM